MKNGLFLFVIALIVDVHGQDLDSLRMLLAVQRDTVELKRCLHDSLVYIHSNGLIENKNDFIEDICSDKIVYQDFMFEQRNELNQTDTSRVFQGIVVVVGLYEGYKFKVKLAFTSIYRLVEDVFQLRYWQSTKLKD